MLAGPWEKPPVDIKGRAMWESTADGLWRTLKVTTGQLSCQHRPDLGSGVIGIPVQRQADCSSRKLSPLVSIRGSATEGPIIGLFMAIVVLVDKEGIRCV